MDVMTAIMQIAVLIFAVIVHEVSHGFVAYWLGDPTARNEGRLTLNPIPHVDPVMSVLLPAVLIFSGAPFIIGGAKPVPINPAYFRNERRDTMLVSLAGPGSNIVLAVISVLLLKAAAMIPVLRSPGFLLFIQYSILINAVLAVFNLLPVPPLDGSKIASFFMPPAMADRYLSIAPYGIFIIIILLASGMLQVILAPVFIVLQKLLAAIL